MTDSRASVLVAEDDPALADVLRLALTRGGFDVQVRKNGLQALELAQAEAFDVVCCDYQMPGMHGEELLRAIRSGGASADAICMLCSAKSYELDCEQLTKELNLQAIFFKPFSLAELVTAVNQGLEMRATV